MIAGISGRIGSGKDLTGKIIQYLSSDFHEASGDDLFNYIDKYPHKSEWQVKKFAGKLKQIVSILTGIPVADLEKQEVKDRVLPIDWNWSYGFDGVSKLVRNIPIDDPNRVRQYTVRELLQRVGTEAMRENIHNNVWINALFSEYKPIDRRSFGDPDDSNVIDPSWIITDVRFPNEAKAIKDRGGLLIRVNRGNLTPSNHISETALDDYNDWDCVIYNNGSIADLVEAVELSVMTKI